MMSRMTFLAGAAALALALGYTAIADSYAVFLIATVALTCIASGAFGSNCKVASTLVNSAM